MIIGGKTWPLDRPWIAAIAVATIGAAAAFAAEWSAIGRLPGGSSRTGLVAGIAAAAIIVFELLLWPRKRVRSWRIGSAQAWLRAHVWLGILSLPLVLIHARLLFFGGLLNWALVVVFLLVIASGVWGLAMQQSIPRTMLDEVPAETIYDQIDHVSRQLCLDLDRLVNASCESDAATPGAHEGDIDADEASHAVVTGYRAMTGIRGKVVETVPVYSAIPGSRPIRRRYHDDIRPYLLTGRAGGSPLAAPPAAAALAESLRAACPEAGDLVDRLESACDQRRQFDLQARLHRWLHGWLLVHVPLSATLGVLLAVHVPVALWYW